MANKKSIIIGSLIIIFSIVVVAIICAENFSCSENPVEGTYQGDVLSFTLNDDETFYFYNDASGFSAEGNYTYSLSEDNKKAYLQLQVTSGICSYDGAVIYFFDDAIILSPTINGSEVVPRRMYKVK